jgi:hypothetical protein
MTDIRCCVCLQLDDPVKAPPGPYRVKGFSVCEKHVELMDECGDLFTAREQMRRYPQRWAL